MIQGGSCARFTTKALECLMIFRDIFRKELECNKAPQFDILSFVDDTHPASADSLDDAIVRDDLPKHWAEILGRGLEQVNECW